MMDKWVAFVVGSFADAVSFGCDGRWEKIPKFVGVDVRSITIISTFP